MDGPILGEIGGHGRHQPRPRLGLEQAGLIGRTRFQTHSASPARDPVRRARAVVDAERLQFPIGPGEHVDTAVEAHQDGHFAVVRAALPGRQEDFFCMFQKGAHKRLIARPVEIVNFEGRAFEGCLAVACPLTIFAFWPKRTEKDSADD